MKKNIKQETESIGVINNEEQLTPSQIVNELDKFIIGQKNAKKSVAIALRNRWRRLQVKDLLRDEIMPNNIIMIGPTGVGKTEIARRISRLSNAPFVKVEASKFTEVGYVGRDVESMIRELTDLSVNMVKRDKLAEVQEKAELNTEEKLLDILLPPIKKSQAADPDGESGNANATIDAQKEMTATREKLRLKLKEGKFDDRIIELDLMQNGSPMMQIFGPIGLDDMGINIRDILGNMMPQKSKKRKLPLREARKYLIQEESNKLIDMDQVIKLAIEKVENSGIVFIDEIDKIAGGDVKGGAGPDVSRQGVQRDLLPIVEGSTVMTKYGGVRTDHILFVASGAFHMSKPSDLIPELQGRFPIRVELDSLGKDEFYKILTQPKNALIKQYKALLASENVTLEFEEDAINEIAKIAAEVNEKVENIGARRLHTILTTLLEDIMFDIPDRSKVKHIKISKNLVTKKLSVITKDRDLSRYIL
ncbi:ATP-dependent protease ATPase subunit HslU [Ignavibacteria bacterium CHB1]|jgi:ATP-dependent HslUV protease ATP-binding subunit HslU|nr:MAG: ATP-dependent protease ATPase subunit HslU [Chlorobiota bacterium]KXK04563.1 MAG: ATP-dependent HslUV protease ATP-binding subunit [Chlorobi bacterium OLB4]MBV6399385.1 ATP-dependent protease ATPase subunit ClpY [Ignavibacteria bacterium]MCC6886862.1 ATP-dependent protease ATPase subunit HslU [Ignavibacteriales bacterium]MCE7953917.1 ATP-dependent protease ATPase subunit HslU [Chlorobi bacterium CHB7]MDL1887850.1 ATP-dependent protease ATPase subunit HslU [Ignavibacteria bacterium CHB1